MRDADAARAKAAVIEGHAMQHRWRRPPAPDTITTASIAWMQWLLSDHAIGRAPLQRSFGDRNLLLSGFEQPFTWGAPLTAQLGSAPHGARL